MTGNIRLPDDLGQLLRARREELGLSKSALADKAGKVREVVYRLEAISGGASAVSRSPPPWWPASPRPCARRWKRQRRTRELPPR
jgi:hypothetical protein